MCPPDYDPVVVFELMGITWVLVFIISRVCVLMNWVDPIENGICAFFDPIHEWIRMRILERFGWILTRAEMEEVERAYLTRRTVQLRLNYINTIEGVENTEKLKEHLEDTQKGYRKLRKRLAGGANTEMIELLDEHLRGPVVRTKYALKR